MFAEAKPDSPPDVLAAENYWESLEETEPQIVSRLARVAAERRWEIIFLTARPASAGAPVQLQSQRWLEARGFVLPSVYVAQQSRGAIAAALGIDLVVGSRPDQCLEVVTDSKARAMLIWRDDEAALPDGVRARGIEIVGSVNECLDTLATIERPAHRERGLLARLRRFLDVKSATGF